MKSLLSEQPKESQDLIHFKDENVDFWTTRTGSLILAYIAAILISLTGVSQPFVILIGIGTYIIGRLGTWLDNSR